MQAERSRKTRRALQIAGWAFAALLLAGCGGKEAEPTAKGYYEGASTTKGRMGVQAGGGGSPASSSQ